MTDAERRRRLDGLDAAPRAPSPPAEQRRDLLLERAVAGDLGALARALGGTPVSEARTDPEERRAER